MTAEQQEILEGNKLIAEFMKLVPAGDGKFWANSSTIIDGEIYSEKWFTLKYNESFDMLMPVVEKIESLGYLSVIEKITNNEFRVFFNLSSTNTHRLNGARDEQRICAIYKAVIEFICWYNKIVIENYQSSGVCINRKLPKLSLEILNTWANENNSTDFFKGAGGFLCYSYESKTAFMKSYKVNSYEEIFTIENFFKRINKPTNG